MNVYMVVKTLNGLPAHSYPPVFATKEHAINGILFEAEVSYGDDPCPETALERQLRESDSLHCNGAVYRIVERKLIGA